LAVFTNISENVRFIAMIHMRTSFLWRNFSIFYQKSPHCVAALFQALEQPNIAYDCLPKVLQAWCI